MFHFPGYHPRNYQPGPPATDEPPLATAHQIRKARDEGGEFIHQDGSRAYMWRYGVFHYADWTGVTYDSWKVWSDEAMPAGELVEL